MADATATPEAATDNVKIEDVGPARKRLTITVPPEAIETKIQESMQTLASETALPGFRKGNVPSKLLERRFGTAVREETKNQVIADAYASAIEDHDIKPIGEPEPTSAFDELKLEDGKPLEFSLEVEVVPEFELPDLDGLEIMRPVLEIEDSHIEREMLRLSRELGEMVDVEGDFEPDDRLLGKAIVSKEGDEEPLHTEERAVVIVPSTDDGGNGPLLGLMIDDLAGAIKGKKVGDEITVTTVGPDGHEREDIRGAKLSITLDIGQANRILPADVETVVGKYGLESEEILREQIKLALEQRRGEEQASAMREQACEQLADLVDFDLPQRLTATQSYRQLERFRNQLTYQGVAPDEIEAKVAQARGRSEEEAQSSLKLFFLMQRLATHFKIDVSEQEINSRIAMLAAQHGQRPDRLKNELAQNNKLTELASQIRDMKAADRLVAQSKITDVTVDEWNAHLAARAGGTGKAKGDAPAKKKTTKKKTKKKSSSKPAAEAPKKKKKTTKKA